MVTVSKGKTRANISLKHDTFAAFVKLGQATGKPAVTVAGELLDEMRDQIEALAMLYSQAKAGKTSAAKRTLQHMIGDLAAEMVSASQPDMFPAKAKAKRK